MTYSEYIKLERRLEGQLARADRRRYLIRATTLSAGAVALVLLVSDATPWPLLDGPVMRLMFILVWSVVMASWQLIRVRRVLDEQTGHAESA